MLKIKHRNLMRSFKSFAGAIVFLFAAGAYGQQPLRHDQLPTGKQYLVGQLAAAEAKISDMLDEIAALRQRNESLQKMLADRVKSPPKE